MGHFLGSTLLVTIHPWSYNSCPTPLTQASVDPTVTRLSSSYWMCSSGSTVFIFLSTGWAEICICWINKWKSPLRDMEWVSVSGPYALLKTVLAKHLWFNSYFFLTALHLLLQFPLTSLFVLYFLPALWRISCPLSNTRRVSLVFQCPEFQIIWVSWVVCW